MSDIIARAEDALADFDRRNTGRVGDYAGVGKVIDAARELVAELKASRQRDTHLHGK